MANENEHENLANVEGYCFALLVLAACRLERSHLFGLCRGSRVAYIEGEKAYKLCSNLTAAYTNAAASLVGGSWGEEVEEGGKCDIAFQELPDGSSEYCSYTDAVALKRIIFNFLCKIRTIFLNSKHTNSFA